jgi:stage II sporulation protein D (peptidoglycan lytic transglycosylase)
MGGVMNGRAFYYMPLLIPIICLIVHFSLPRQLHPTDSGSGPDTQVAVADPFANMPRCRPIAQPPIIRVWLSDVVGQPTISADGPCLLSPIKGDLPLRRSARLDNIVARCSGSGVYLGSTNYGAEGVIILPVGATRLSVNGNRYSGGIHLWMAAGKLSVINHVEIEDYVEGVLAGEMPAAWPADALMAQAVAARSYVLHARMMRLKAEWDVKSSVEDQVYRPGKSHSPYEEAVAHTRGQVLLHDGHHFSTFYHSTCGGRTLTPRKAMGKDGFDFYEGVACAHCSQSKRYRWTCAISAAALASDLREAGYGVDSRPTGVDVVERAGGAGLLASVTWQGGSVDVPMVAFRRIAGRMKVSSGNFTCVPQGDALILSGRGFGHGAGMCQYGARGQASNGVDWKSILHYYYKSVELVKLY